MKRKYGLFLLVIFFMFNSSLVYAKDSKKDMEVTVKKNIIKEATTYIKADLSIPSISILNNEKLGNYISDKIYQDILSWRSDLTELAHNYEDDFKKDNLVFNPFELFVKYDVTYNKNSLLSIPITFYQYTGGAHGLTTKIAYNFDLESGEQLKLSEIFKESSDYKDKIDQFIKQEISKNPSIYFNNGEDFKGIKEKQDFYFSEDGLVIYFQLYDIAPYSSGIMEFKIPYPIIKDSLKYKFE